MIRQAVLEKKMFESVKDDGDDGRTPDHEYHISSPMSLWLRRANKNKCHNFSSKYCQFCNFTAIKITLLHRC